MTETQTVWFLYTFGLANESIANVLTQAGIAEESQTEVLYEGNKVPVWRVPFHFAAMMLKNRHDHPFNFVVLVQEGGGNVRRWNLQNRGSLARQKSVRDARKALRELTHT